MTDALYEAHQEIAAHKAQIAELRAKLVEASKQRDSEYQRFINSERNENSIAIQLADSRAREAKLREALPPLTEKEAQALAMRTDYAVEACDANGENPINEADALEFFRLGYEHARAILRAALREEEPK